MKIVILANDIGEKLWPLTSPSLPKALLPLYSKNTMLVETIMRCMPLCENHGNNIYIVTTTKAKKKIRADGVHTQFKIPLKNILTSDSDNTIEKIIKKLDYFSDEEIVAFIPADQFFWPEEGFIFHLTNTIKGVESYPNDIICMTMQPGMAASNMNYIQVDWETRTLVGTVYTPPAGDPEKDQLSTMLARPLDYKIPLDPVEAEQLMLDGWVWDLKTFVSYMRNFRELINHKDSEIISNLIQRGRINIVLANRVIWSVLDNWAALKYLTYDAGIFPIKEDPKVHSIDSFSNLVKNVTNKEVILIGVEGLIIVETEDKLLIATAGGAHEHL